VPKPHGTYLTNKYDNNYSFCDFSHLYRIAGELTQFNDYKQYGQLASRAFGLTVSDGTSLLNCVTEGFAGINGRDFSDVGNCVGQISSQILDSQFWAAIFKYKKGWRGYLPPI